MLERVSGKDVDSPKHGKLDSKNEPHVGGNTWAGGTGKPTKTDTDKHKDRQINTKIDRQTTRTSPTWEGTPGPGHW